MLFAPVPHISQPTPVLALGSIQPTAPAPDDATGFDAMLRQVHPPRARVSGGAGQYTCAPSPTAGDVTTNLPSNDEVPLPSCCTMAGCGGAVLNPANRRMRLP